MKYRGARAVLENKKGKLITKISANSSIWPGRVKDKAKLSIVTPTVTNRIISPKTIALSLFKGEFPINNEAVTMNITCIKLIQVIKVAEDKIIEVLDIKGAVNKRFKNPNSRSNIKGRPELSAPVNDVKIIIPELKKTVIACVNSK